jgi:hypothetical protein
MLAGKVYRQTRALRRSAHPFPDPRVNAVPDYFTIAQCHNY